MTFKCPFIAAQWIASSAGKTTSPPIPLGFAPSSLRNLTTSKWPISAARPKAVVSRSFTSLTLLSWLFTRYLTTSNCPFAAARCKTLSPHMSFHCEASWWRRRINLIKSTCPWSEAKWIAVDRRKSSATWSINLTEQSSTKNWNTFRHPTFAASWTSENPFTICSAIKRLDEVGNVFIVSNCLTLFKFSSLTAACNSSNPSTLCDNLKNTIFSQFN